MLKEVKKTLEVQALFQPKKRYLTEEPIFSGSSRKTITNMIKRGSIPTVVDYSGTGPPSSQDDLIH